MIKNAIRGIILFTLCIGMLYLGGCEQNSDVAEIPMATSTPTPTATFTPTPTPTPTSTPTPTATSTPTLTPTPTPVVFGLNAVNVQYHLIPAYTGEKMVNINGGIPFFDEAEAENNVLGISLSPLDELGRTGSACACLSWTTIEKASSDEKGELSGITPSAWHSNAGYHRSHLIMNALYGSETDDERNIITGFSFFNKTLMLSLERHITDYIKTHKDVVINYRVTPVYGPVVQDSGTAENLLAAGVLMEALSSDGGLTLCKFVYNVPESMEGMDIDYATGLIGTDENVEEAIPSENKIWYIANVNTEKFHNPSCDSVKQMKEKNKWEIVSDEFGSKENAREMLIKSNFKPCQNCKP